MRTIDELIAAIETEARRADFPIDTPVYQAAGKDALRPVLYAGSLDAPVCVVGRALGRDEVVAGQPLIGAGGRLVREGFFRAAHGGQAPPKTDRTIFSVLESVLLTNTVPYKPPGNKAYSGPVKERFRPFLSELLAVHWRGHRVITLGTEAFQWFAPYAPDPDAFATFWRRDDRYEAALVCHVSSRPPGLSKSITKTLTVSPLPHPSPLNQRWYSRFPDLLDRCLAATS
jgi:uracil-DNA glycosylase